MQYFSIPHNINAPPKLIMLFWQDKWISMFSNIVSSGYHVSVDGLEDFSSFAPELKHVQMVISLLIKKI